MRKTWPVLLVLMMLLTLCFLSVQAEEDEDDVSFYAEIDAPSPTPLPDPNATPTPEPTPEPTATPMLQADGSKIVTITAVGDVTIGRDVYHENPGKGLFNKELANQNDDPNFIFRNVKDIFEKDDVTIINFEGTLLDDFKEPKKLSKSDYKFHFVAPTAYAAIFPANGVEVATMENNHVRDFGSEGVSSTTAAMDNAGVVWANTSHMAVYETQGVRIGILAYQTLADRIAPSSELASTILPRAITEAKETCDLVICAFHWGEEMDYSPRDNQIMLGRAAIDAGADLVIGHHSHRVNPIEQYKGKFIVYSLGNCSFCGNSKPSDMLTFIFQTRFRFRGDEMVENTFRIIPCRISSRTDYNDFAITPLTRRSDIDTLTDAMTKRENIRKLEYAVTYLPQEWEQ